MKRCSWVTDDKTYREYHDKEWGVPLFDNQKLFEMLILEGTQAGLSWITILKRRRAYQLAFDGFDPGIMARWDDAKIEALMADQSIIRNRLKIEAARSNAAAYMSMMDSGEDFADFLWSFVGGTPIQNSWKDHGVIPSQTAESKAMAEKLKLKGFKFVGPTICYAFMQAVGMVNDHLVECFRHQEIERKKTMSEYEFYLVEKKPPIAWVFLNRPDKKNAMGPSAWKEPESIFNDLDNDPEIRAVVIAGKGSSFSVGIDLMGMVGELPELMDNEQKGGIKWKLLPRIKRLQAAISSVERCKKPVIAAIHGYCIGAGLDLVTACDIRICSKDAIFSLRETAVGFVADVGVLQRIPAIVGQGHARELAYTARNITAERAEQIQLVNQVYDTKEVLMENAAMLAREIAENSPLAVQASKDVLNFCVDKSVQDGLDYVASISANIIPSNDLMEALTAFGERRKPKFSGT
jgi:enoyl-CoA hydratase